MKKILKMLISFVSAAAVVMSVSFSAFADDAPSASSGTAFVIEDSNFSFSLPAGWNGVAKGNMDRTQLDAMGLAEATVVNDFRKNNGVFYGKNPTKSIVLYVTNFSDNNSERIFNSKTGDYSLISQYLNDAEKYKYITFPQGWSVVRANDKVNAGGAVFYVVEYKSSGYNGMCYSTVVNGKYITFDFRCLTGNFTDADKIKILNSVKSVEILNIEEKPTLDRSQLIIIGGVALLVIILFAGIIHVNNKKKRY